MTTPEVDPLDGLKAAFLHSLGLTPADLIPEPPEERAARETGMRECRRRHRRMLGEEAWFWEYEEVDVQADPSIKYPTVPGSVYPFNRKACLTFAEQWETRRPVCRFPACGALDTVGIPLDAERRAIYKVPRQPHDPE
jgi:hypothetical protein